MASTSQNSRERMNDVRVIVDSDFHITEKQDDFLPYIEDPFHKRLFERDEYGKDFDKSEDSFKSFYPSPGVFAPYNTGNIESRTVSTKEDVKEAMDFLAIDYPVVTPTQNLYLPGVQHDDFAAALAAAYNEWVADTILDADENIYGGILLAPHKPARAAEELKKWADEDAFVSAFIPSGGVNPPLGDKSYFPVWEAAQDAGLPVLLHAASGAAMDSFPLQKQAFTRYLPQHALVHAMQSMIHISTMITEGLPVRYPEVKFIIQESGLGWVPFLMRRLDHEYKTEREDAPLLEKMPSEYIVEQFRFTTQPIEGDQDPQYIGNIFRQMGAEQTVMFASDHPHYDFDITNELHSLVRHEFDIDEINNMYGQTALDTFSFPDL